MTLFLLLMVPCLIAILCAAVAVGGKAGFGLALVMLTLQGLTIVAYSNYHAVSNMDPAYAQCERVEAGSDLGPLLATDHGYTLTPNGENITGSPQYIASSPACFN